MRRRNDILGALGLLAGLLMAGAVGCDVQRASADSDGSQAAEAEESEPEAEEESTKVEAESGSEAETGEETDEGSTDGEVSVERMMDPTAPMPKQARRALESIEFDPKPKDLTRDSHYWVSNENHHYLIREQIADHEGLFVGVGTDQVYMMAAWAKSPIILPMDFDEQIRNVHHLYGVVLKRTDDPQTFIHRWSDTHKEKIEGWIEEDYGDERVAELKKTLEMANDHIYYRLRTTAEQYRKAEVPCFITDQSQYDFIKGLWERGRVVPLRGNLIGGTTMLQMAETLKQLGLRLGLLYTSNAEQYFEFTPEYRRNIVVQPFAEESLVLRTRPMEALGVAEGAKYHYNLQKGRNFAEWMQYNHITKVSHLMLWYKSDLEETDGVSYIRKEAPHSDNAPDIAEVGDYDLEIDAPTDTP
jgi:hypothetical protein